MTDDLSRLNELYGFEISTDISPDVYEYVLLNLSHIRKFRLQFDVPVIGIAGRHGKTVTKRMLSTILASRGEVLETPPFSLTATNVTSTLLKLTDQISYVILEFGIRHANQFKLAVHIAAPTHAIVTNIGESNYAYLGDKMLVSEIKSELIKAVDESGAVVLNFDDDLCSMLEKFARTPNVIKVGLNQNSHFFASDIEYLGPEGIRFMINGIHPVHLKVYSTSEIYNALSAVALARTLDFSLQESIQLLQQDFRLPPGRGNLIEGQKGWILDFSYDASPESIAKSSRALIDFRNHASRLIMIIGEIGDFGEKNDFYYHNTGYFMGALSVDSFYTIGKKAAMIAEGIRKVNQQAQVKTFPGLDLEAVSSSVMDELETKTAILVTGSHQQELHKLTHILTHLIQ